ncbi:GNAT family N-acetyltransferase [Salinispora tropica]|uniref:GCN5-related N-acetyltransferase n=1 Tax=Salinispora tropica (strain ATCC BAA-916 / DSM 44818 / JCM 13857 / NBRC 105044 / CNB-440) TaxID=369723 RepID=A4X6J7_SALTO|nr:GNAT family N-acetyltransferase [Salinispora tropica]ABP54497.1 GCN5-related N-acetyltransferase [Salinispora tropica CNB-440]
MGDDRRPCRCESEEDSLLIRSARQLELGDLAWLEVQAGQLFHSVGMSEIADHDVDQQALRRSQRQGLIWVAEEGDRTVGYVMAAVLDGNAHIEQVSVAPTHARRGVGRRLISHVERWGRRNGRPATTLTTFRDVPWNGPYYRRLGYRELSNAEIGRDLTAAIRHEAALPGMDSSLRCAMIKANREHLDPD